MITTGAGAGTLLKGARVTLIAYGNSSGMTLIFAWQRKAMNKWWAEVLRSAGNQINVFFLFWIRSQCYDVKNAYALWSRSTKNPNGSTGPLARPHARLLAPFIHSLDSHCSLRSRALLRSFVRTLFHSLTSKLMAKRMINDGTLGCSRP